MKRSHTEANVLKAARIAANAFGHNLTRQDDAEKAADTFEEILKEEMENKKPK